MNEKQIETQVREVVAATLGVRVDEVAANASYDALELDSLDRVDVLLQVEEHFGIRASGVEEELRIKSVGGLIEFAKQKLGEKTVIPTT